MKKVSIFAAAVTALFFTTNVIAMDHEEKKDKEAVEVKKEDKGHKKGMKHKKGHKKGHKKNKK